jgi:RNA polymerase sigma factor (sigma-70 family)
MREPADDDVKKLFEEILPDIPKVVRKACLSLGRNPHWIDTDEFAQQIRVLLWKDDYRMLRSFKYDSEPETWMFTIAKRLILHWFRDQGRRESLEDKLSDFFVVQPDHEEKLLSTERVEILRRAISKLTGHDKKLYSLWRQERSRKEISEEMGIKRRSVSVEKAALAKKLRRIIGADYEV